jgi:hypothetical protein
VLRTDAGPPVAHAAVAEVPALVVGVAGAAAVHQALLVL